jgi:hypothetical protein
LLVIDLVRSQQQVTPLFFSGHTPEMIIPLDAMPLPFEADYFDSCRSERLLKHLLNPGQALSEMIR